MGIAYQHLNWQQHNQDKLVSRFVDNTVDSVSEQAKVDCLQESLQIEEGFVLTRETLCTNVPIHYPDLTSDYIGFCYTFIADYADAHKTALPHLFHDQLNYTNGLDYEPRTHQLLDQPIYYVSLRFSRDYLNTVHKQQALPSWVMRLVDSERGQVGRIAMSKELQQYAWQILQLPYLKLSSFSDRLMLQAIALKWFAKLITEQPSTGFQCQQFVKMNYLATQNAKSSVKNRLPITTIEQACKCIEEAFNQSINASELAYQLGTNECYLKQAFRQHTGKSIHQYLTDYRLQRACMLLREPLFTINHVADVCGYQPSHFSQVFKKYIGITPRAYREQLLKK